MMLLYKINGEANGVINFSEKLQVDNLAKALDGRIEENQIIFVSAESEIEAAEGNALQKIKEWADGIEK